MSEGLACTGGRGILAAELIPAIVVTSLLATEIDFSCPGDGLGIDGACAMPGRGLIGVILVVGTGGGVGTPEFDWSVGNCVLESGAVGEGIPGIGLAVSKGLEVPTGGTEGKESGDDIPVVEFDEDRLYGDLGSGDDSWGDGEELRAICC
jgi:hypothetical protein